MTKLKNLNWDNTHKFKLWQNWKTQIVTKLKNSYRDKTQKSKRDKTPKLKLWKNWKTQIETKLKNSNYDKTQKLKFWHLKKGLCTACRAGLFKVQYQQICCEAAGATLFDETPISKIHHLEKLPLLLNQWCNFNILWDLEFPKHV